MKVEALWITGIRQIETRLTEIDDAPAYDQVQVEIKACGICAWDGALFSGVTSPGPFPFMHGHEGIGYVRQTGAGVTDLKVGDLVMCSEDTPQMMQVQNIARSAVARIDADVAEKDLPLWVGEPIVCVINSLANMKIKPASTVALVGSGYMGLLKVQALMRQLIGDLVVFDIDPRRLALAKKYGADHAFISGSSEADEYVRDLQSKGGAELVIECSGSEAGLDLANNLMAQSGTLNLFAWHRTARTINMTPWHQRGYTVLNTAPNFDRHYRDHVAETVALMHKGVFDQTDLITHVAPYTQAQAIMEAAVNKTENYIKGVITF
jgi:threonine dehydrogenase-like Zn-dependent dehydrogenase